MSIKCWCGAALHRNHAPRGVAFSSQTGAVCLFARLNYCTAFSNMKSDFFSIPVIIKTRTQCVVFMVCVSSSPVGGELIHENTALLVLPLFGWEFRHSLRALPCTCFLKAFGSIYYSLEVTQRSLDEGLTPIELNKGVYDNPTRFRSERGKDMYHHELKATVPRRILECPAVSREINFTSQEEIRQFRLEQRVFLAGACIEGGVACKILFVIVFQLGRHLYLSSMNTWLVRDRFLAFLSSMISSMLSLSQQHC